MSKKISQEELESYLKTTNFRCASFFIRNRRRRCPSPVFILRATKAEFLSAVFFTCFSRQAHILRTAPTHLVNSRRFSEPNAHKV